MATTQAKVITGGFVAAALASDVDRPDSDMDPRQHVGRQVVRDVVRVLQSGSAKRLPKPARIFSL